MEQRRREVAGGGVIGEKGCDVVRVLFTNDTQNTPEC